VSLLARFRAWFVSSVVAPELLSSQPGDVDIILDEDDLFEAPRLSGTRLKIGRVATQYFVPSEELLDASREEEVTLRVDVKELREHLAAASGNRRR